MILSLLQPRATIATGLMVEFPPETVKRIALRAIASPDGVAFDIAPGEKPRPVAVAWRQRQREGWSWAVLVADYHSGHEHLHWPVHKARQRAEFYGQLYHSKQLERQRRRFMLPSPDLERRFVVHCLRKVGIQCPSAKRSGQWIVGPMGEHLLYIPRGTPEDYYAAKSLWRPENGDMLAAMQRGLKLRGSRYLKAALVAYMVGRLEQ